MNTIRHTVIGFNPKYQRSQKFYIMTIYCRKVSRLFWTFYVEKLSVYHHQPFSNTTKTVQSFFYRRLIRCTCSLDTDYQSISLAEQASENLTRSFDRITNGPRYHGNCTKLRAWCSGCLPVLVEARQLARGSSRDRALPYHFAFYVAVYIYTSNLYMSHHFLLDIRPLSF